MITAQKVLTQDEEDLIRAEGEGMVPRREDDHPDNTEPISFSPTQWEGEPSDVAGLREKERNDVCVLAEEITRINAQGGVRRKDETARVLYNASAPLHDWEALTSRLPSTVAAHQVEEWRRAAKVVDGWVEGMFPSAEACEIADRLLDQRSGVRVEERLGGRGVPDSPVEAVSGRLAVGTRVRSVVDGAYGMVTGWERDLKLPIVCWEKRGTEGVEPDEYETVE